MLLFHNHNYNKLLLHLVFILIFSILYYLTQFNKVNNPITFYECFYFSIVTQTTVGFGNLLPNNNLMKHISIAQMLMLFVIMLY